MNKILVTFSTDEDVFHFGNIIDGFMVSFSLSEAICEGWFALPRRFPGLSLDSFMLMPDHIHGLISLRKESFPHLSNEEERELMLRRIIYFYKELSTNLVHREGFPNFSWKRGYYRYLISPEKSSLLLREYIISNTRGWNSGRSGFQSSFFRVRSNEPFELILDF